MPFALTVLEQKNTDAFRALYEGAFPAVERIPFSMLQRRARQGRVENLALTKDGVFTGLVVMVPDARTALVLFFAVSPNARGKGVGSAALRLIRERYADKRVFLEIEDPACPSGNGPQRVRRKRFYQKNGWLETGARCKIYGTDMLLLAPGEGPALSEYRAALRRAYGLAGYARQHPRHARVLPPERPV